MNFISKNWIKATFDVINLPSVLEHLNDSWKLAQYSIINLIGSLIYSIISNGKWANWDVKQSLFCLDKE